MLKFDYEYYLQLPSNCLVVYILMRWYVSTRHACMNKKEIWMSRYNTIKKNQQQYNGADEEKRKKNAEWTHASFEWMVIMTTILMASHKLLFVIFLYLSAVFFFSSSFLFFPIFSPCCVHCNDRYGTDYGHNKIFLSIYIIWLYSGVNGMPATIAPI